MSHLLTRIQVLSCAIQRTHFSLRLLLLVVTALATLFAREAGKHRREWEAAKQLEKEQCKIVAKTRSPPWLWSLLGETHRQTVDRIDTRAQQLEQTLASLQDLPNLSELHILWLMEADLPEMKDRVRRLNPNVKVSEWSIIHGEGSIGEFAPMTECELEPWSDNELYCCVFDICAAHLSASQVSSWRRGNPGRFAIRRVLHSEALVDHLLWHFEPISPSAVADYDSVVSIEHGAIADTELVRVALRIAWLISDSCANFASAFRADSIAVTPHLPKRS